MKYLLSPFIQVVDINGTPIAGAKIYVYEADTTTDVQTYQNFDGGLNPTSVITDELGNATVLVDDDCGSCDVYIYYPNDTLLMSKKYCTPGVFGGGAGSRTTVIAGFGTEVVETSTNVFKVSVDTDLIATKDDIQNLQNKLTAGENIEITPSSVINVVGRKRLGVISPVYAVETDTAVYFGVSSQQINSGDFLTTAQYSVDSGTYLTSHQSLTDYATINWTNGQLAYKLDTSAFSAFSANLNRTEYKNFYTTGNPGGTSSFDGDLVISQRADNHGVSPIEVAIDTVTAGYLVPVSPSSNGYILTTNNEHPDWVYSGDLLKETEYYNTCISSIGAHSSFYYKDHFSIQQNSEGKWPVAIFGTIDWASTDGYMSMVPTNSISNTGYIVGYDEPTNLNAGHGYSDVWESQYFTFTAENNYQMKYIAIKGGFGQSLSCANIHYTCVY